MFRSICNLTSILEEGKNQSQECNTANLLAVLVRRSDVVRLGTAAIIFTLAILTLFGNAFVMSLILMDRKLWKQASNLLVANLSLAGMLAAVLVMIPSGISVLMDEWPFSDSLCNLHCGMIYWCMGQTQMTVCLLSIDRFVSTWRPLHYRTIITRGKILIALVFTWCVVCVLGIGPIVGQWAVYDYWEVSCQIDWYHYPEVRPWSQGFFGAMLALPSTVIIASSIYISAAVRTRGFSKTASISLRRTRRLRRPSRRQQNVIRCQGAVDKDHNHTTADILLVIGTPTNGAIHHAVTGNGHKKQIKIALLSNSLGLATSFVKLRRNHRFLPKTRFAQRSTTSDSFAHQSKANQRIYFSISVVTLCFFFCVSPFSVTKLMKLWTQDINVLPPTVCLFFTVMYFCNSLVNPLIYGLLRIDFRRAYFRLRVRFKSGGT